MLRKSTDIKHIQPVFKLDDREFLKHFNESSRQHKDETRTQAQDRAAYRCIHLQRSSTIPMILTIPAILVVLLLLYVIFDIARTI